MLKVLAESMKRITKKDLAEKSSVSSHRYSGAATTSP